MRLCRTECCSMLMCQELRRLVATTATAAAMVPDDKFRLQQFADK